MSELDAVQRLTRDLKNASVTLSKTEARFLVDYYYLMQEDRIRAAHQSRTLDESEEPHEVIGWLGSQVSTLEQQIKLALAAYTEADPVGRWSQSVVGIGPIISACLLAHIDITKAPTVGHIWRFAGQDPTSVWSKGTKRPWNASLKTLCWKIGESFVKVSGRENDVYGKLYLQRKAIEIARNESGELAEQAERKLANFKIGKDTDAYKAYITGKLPPGHIHARAKRWAVKLFLAHWHVVAYETHYGVKAPRPYILTHDAGHAHEILVPGNWRSPARTR